MVICLMNKFPHKCASLTNFYLLQLTIYDLNNRDAESGTASLLGEFSGYEGFLSSGRFISDESIVTGITEIRFSEATVHIALKSLTDLNFMLGIQIKVQL